MSKDNTGQSSNASETQPPDSSRLLDEVFSLFKEYLTEKLEEKGKQMEFKSKLDREVTQLRYIGNQKLFDSDAELIYALDLMKLRMRTKASINVSSQLQ